MIGETYALHITQQIEKKITIIQLSQKPYEDLSCHMHFWNVDFVKEIIEKYTPVGIYGDLTRQLIWLDLTKKSVSDRRQTPVWNIWKTQEFWQFIHIKDKIVNVPDSYQVLSASLQMQHVTEYKNKIYTMCMNSNYLEKVLKQTYPHYLTCCPYQYLDGHAEESWKYIQNEDKLILFPWNTILQHEINQEELTLDGHVNLVYHLSGFKDYQQPESNNPMSSIPVSTEDPFAKYNQYNDIVREKRKHPDEQRHVKQFEKKEKASHILRKDRKKIIQTEEITLQIIEEMQRERKQRDRIVTQDRQQLNNHTKILEQQEKKIEELEELQKKIQNKPSAEQADVHSTVEMNTFLNEWRLEKIRYGIE